MTENGGVIKINSRKINVVLNHFVKNNAQFGSAIYFSEMVCNNCSKNNTVLYQNHFYDNNAVSDGTIYLSKYTFVRSIFNRFTNNKGRKGGVYYVDKGSELSIISENSTYNQADFGSIVYFLG